MVRDDLPPTPENRKPSEVKLVNHFLRQWRRTDSDVMEWHVRLSEDHDQVIVKRDSMWRDGLDNMESKTLSTQVGNNSRGEVNKDQVRWEEVYITSYRTKIPTTIRKIVRWGLHSSSWRLYLTKSKRVLSLNCPVGKKFRANVLVLKIYFLYLLG